MTEVSPQPEVTCKGGCHCGSVRYRALFPGPIRAFRCNCSICSQTGFIHVFVQQAHFELLEGHDVPLIEDDVWGCLGLANPRPVTAKSFDRSGNVILLSSFSKTVSPGLRLGWMAPGKFLQEVVRQKFLVNLSTGVVQQQAIADFLDGSRFRRLTQSSSKIYARRRKFLRDAVIRHFPPGTLCSVPRGGFFIWVELPGNVDSYELFKLAVNEGISFSPGRLYSRTSTYSHCLRLSCSVDDDAVVENAIRELAWLVPR